jgi:trehalose 6-phosphate synthase/phosphatase
LVSNRLGVNVERIRGKLRFKGSIGGVATGLATVQKRYGSPWVGWPGISLDSLKEGEDAEIREKLASEFNSCPVLLTDNEVEGYYHGFCNRTIWPLFHYFPQFATFDRSLWEFYNRANEMFKEAVLSIVRGDDIIWIHDYQLMLLPELIRREMPDAAIGFFLHIPFPSFEIFRLLPWRDEILKGLLGADLIGFHTYDYVRHFLGSVHFTIGLDNVLGQINLPERVVKADSFPMGIDYGRFRDEGSKTETKKNAERLKNRLGNRKVIISIDRLDYTKGTLKKLMSYERFLQKYRDYREKVVLMLVSVPSRTQVEQYKALKREIEELVGRINGEYGTIGWDPISYLYRFLPFSTLISLYSLADVALITPARDGMNLIAKELIASKVDGKGMLIISETAGASKELSEAIVVNPNDVEAMADAIKEALTVSEEEQRQRNEVMQKRLERYDIMKWAEEFREKLIATKETQAKLLTKRLDHMAISRLAEDFKRGKRRLLLLDYDGTLTPFRSRLDKARPGEEILSALRDLSRDPRNEIVMLSGREKTSLDRWFGELSIDLVAEHGAWIKLKGGDWELASSLKNKWKGDIKPVLERYVDSTPGSSLEEKDFSIAWHYRRADPALGSARARELSSDLVNRTANLDLQILQGSKVVEVKSASVNKGIAASRWLSDGRDFILAAGDDVTDEDLFSVLPEGAYSIKIGFGPSKAEFDLSSSEEMLSLLRELSDASIA